jgi:hypothetical protein
MAGFESSSRSALVIPHLKIVDETVINQKSAAISHEWMGLYADFLSC